MYAWLENFRENPERNQSKKCKVVTVLSGSLLFQIRRRASIPNLRRLSTGILGGGLIYNRLRAYY
jgi:hypothetical protein